MENSTSNSKGKFYLIALIVGALLYLALAFVYSYSASLATSLKDSVSTPEDARNGLLAVVQMLYCVPLVGLAIYFFRDDFKKYLQDFKENKSNHMSIIVLGVFGCLFANGLVSYIYSLLGITGDAENQEIINNVLGGSGAIPMIISVMFIAPFVEEMLFRKLLCGTCTYTFHLPPIITIIIATLLFSFVHVADLENLKFIFQYIPLAFAITYSFYKSKNIFVPMGIHFINNTISVIAFYLLMFLGQ